MLYSSTRMNDKNVEFSQVLMNGLAKDGGLYVPNEIPKVSQKDLKFLKEKSYAELVFEITKRYVVSEQIPEKSYKKICNKTYGKEFGKKLISIDKLNDNEFILNLFHGPTLAFKDYALQLLGNLYDYILKKKKENLTLIGATSGDTGSAAIHGCSKSKKAKIFILFPKNKISEVQRKQMTTYVSENVFNIAVKGNFDDCQKLVKDFFKLNVKTKKYNLGAVNSINWVRILGQIVYYFWAYLRIEKNFKPINFVVPTGNFGNVYAGFISKKMGLPIKKLIVCSNKNDILTRFFNSGEMKKKKVVKSLSPSMDIQVSSNFERLIFNYISNGKRVSKFFNELDNKGNFIIPKKILDSMLNEFSGGKLNDRAILNTIKYIYKKFSIIIDPHTAVGYSVGNKILKKSEKRVYLATAHYSKFMETVEDSIKKKLNYPDKLKKILKKDEEFLLINNSLNELESLVDSN